MEQSIRDPGAYLVPGFSPVMPTLGVPDDDVVALVDYLLGNQTGSGPG